MTNSAPISLLDDFPGWSVEFDLYYRQEFSRTAGGVTIAKDMGTPLWQATFQSRTMKPNELDMWRARLKALEGSLQRLWAWPSSRCYPIAYPKGSGMGDVSAVKIGALGADNKTVTLTGLPAGYQVSVGDYIQIGARYLYQVVNIDDVIEIRSHLAPGTAVNDVVTLTRPSCPMIIVPNSLTSTAEFASGRGAITFQAIESR